LGSLCLNFRLFDAFRSAPSLRQAQIEARYELGKTIAAYCRGLTTTPWVSIIVKYPTITGFSARIASNFLATAALRARRFADERLALILVLVHGASANFDNEHATAQLIWIDVRDSGDLAATFSHCGHLDIHASSPRKAEVHG
jgi:hypothetical protein